MTCPLFHALRKRLGLMRVTASWVDSIRDISYGGDQLSDRCPRTAGLLHTVRDERPEPAAHDASLARTAQFPRNRSL
jgi:hypothetical protein